MFLKISEENHHFHLRRSIMEMLYRTFRDHPYLAVELRQVEIECNTNPKSLNWNLVYLEKCGYVELGRSYDCEPYIAPFVTLTAEGIDLVEDADRFNQRFPVSEW